MANGARLPTDCDAHTLTVTATDHVGNTTVGDQRLHELAAVGRRDCSSWQAWQPSDTPTPPRRSRLGERYARDR